MAVLPDYVSTIVSNGQEFDEIIEKLLAFKISQWGWSEQYIEDITSQILYNGNPAPDNNIWYLPVGNYRLMTRTVFPSGIIPLAEDPNTTEVNLYVFAADEDTDEKHYLLQIGNKKYCSVLTRAIDPLVWTPYTRTDENNTPIVDIVISDAAPTDTNVIWIDTSDEDRIYIRVYDGTDWVLATIPDAMLPSVYDTNNVQKDFFVSVHEALETFYAVVEKLHAHIANKRTLCHITEEQMQYYETKLIHTADIEEAKDPNSTLFRSMMKYLEDIKEDVLHLSSSREKVNRVNDYYTTHITGNMVVGCKTDINFNPFFDDNNRVFVRKIIYNEVEEQYLALGTYIMNDNVYDYHGYAKVAIGTLITNPGAWELYPVIDMESESELMDRVLILDGLCINGTYILVGTDSDSSMIEYIFTSKDGKNWTKHTDTNSFIGPKREGTKLYDFSLYYEGPSNTREYYYAVMIRNGQGTKYQILEFRDGNSYFNSMKTVTEDINVHTAIPFKVERLATYVCGLAVIDNTSKTARLMYLKVPAVPDPSNPTELMSSMYHTNFDINWIDLEIATLTAIKISVVNPFEACITIAGQDRTTTKIAHNHINIVDNNGSFTFQEGNFTGPWTVDIVDDTVYEPFFFDTQHCLVMRKRYTLPRYLDTSMIGLTWNHEKVADVETQIQWEFHPTMIENYYYIPYIYSTGGVYSSKVARYELTKLILNDRDKVHKHITQEDIDNWDNKALANHKHDDPEVHDVTIDGSEVYGSSTNPTIPLNRIERAKERYILIDDIDDLRDPITPDERNSTYHNGNSVYTKDEDGNLKIWKIVDDTKIGTSSYMDGLVYMSEVSRFPHWDNLIKPSDPSELGIPPYLKSEDLQFKFNPITKEEILSNTITGTRFDYTYVIVQKTLTTGGGTEDYPMTSEDDQLDVTLIFRFDKTSSPYYKYYFPYTFRIKTPTVTDSNDWVAGIDVYKTPYNAKYPNLTAFDTYFTDDHNPLWATDGIGYQYQIYNYGGSSDKDLLEKTYSINGVDYNLKIKYDHTNGIEVYCTYGEAYGSAYDAYNFVKANQPIAYQNLKILNDFLAGETGFSYGIEQPIIIDEAILNTLTVVDKNVEDKIKYIGYLASTVNANYPDGFFVGVFNHFGILISVDGMKWEGGNRYFDGLIAGDTLEASNMCTSLSTALITSENSEADTGTYGGRGGRVTVDYNDGGINLEYSTSLHGGKMLLTWVPINSGGGTVYHHGIYLISRTQNYSQRFWTEPDTGSYYNATSQSNKLPGQKHDTLGVSVFNKLDTDFPWDDIAENCKREYVDGAHKFMGVYNPNSTTWKFRVVDPIEKTYTDLPNFTSSTYGNQIPWQIYYSEIYQKWFVIHKNSSLVLVSSNNGTSWTAWAQPFVYADQFRSLPINDGTANGTIPSTGSYSNKVHPIKIFEGKKNLYVMMSDHRIFMYNPDPNSKFYNRRAGYYTTGTSSAYFIPVYNPTEIKQNTLVDDYPANPDQISTCYKEDMVYVAYGGNGIITLDETKIPTEAFNTSRDSYSNY